MLKSRVKLPPNLTLEIDRSDFHCWISIRSTVFPDRRSSSLHGRPSRAELFADHHRPLHSTAKFLLDEFVDIVR